MYFANPCSPRVTLAMIFGALGFIDTPRQRNVRPLGVPWVADNGCFGKGYPGDSELLEWLRTQSPADCKFAVAPDVVGDAKATALRSAPFLEPIRQLGYPVAYVAQDGLTFDAAPWADFDVLFIGGTTEWKLGDDARCLVYAAREQQKWVHMGRVNTLGRLRYAHSIGCDSVDGTFLIFGPDQNLPRLLRWLKKIERYPVNDDIDMTKIRCGECSRSFIHAMWCSHYAEAAPLSPAAINLIMRVSPDAYVAEQWANNDAESNRPTLAQQAALNGDDRFLKRDMTNDAVLAYFAQPLLSLPIEPEKIGAVVAWAKKITNPFDDPVDTFPG